MIYWIIVIYILYRWICPPKIPHVLNVYFGVPGSEVDIQDMGAFGDVSKRQDKQGTITLTVK